MNDILGAFTSSACSINFTRCMTYDGQHRHTASHTHTHTQPSMRIMWMVDMGHVRRTILLCRVDSIVHVITVASICVRDLCTLAVWHRRMQKRNTNGRQQYAICQNGRKIFSCAHRQRSRTHTHTYAQLHIVEEKSRP